MEPDQQNQIGSERELMNSDHRQSSNGRLPDTKGRPSTTCRAVAVLLLAILLGMTSASADRRPTRPVLRPAQRDLFAGRIVAIPPENYAGTPPQIGRSGQLKLLAEVVDYDLVTPPASMTRMPADLPDWILENIGIETDGLIVSWERISGTGHPEPDRLLNKIRRERPRLPVFLIVERGLPKEALDHLRAGRIDLIACDENEEIEPSLAEKIVLFDDHAAALPLLIARMVNLRFGETPRIYPIYSPSNAKSGANSGQLSPDQQIRSQIRRKIKRQIEAAGGTEFTPGPAAGTPDILLFIQLPGSSAMTLRSMIAGLQETIDRNVRIAILDLATDRESKELLFAELQSRRWLDRLAGFASTKPDTDSVSEPDSLSPARAISQSVLFLVAIRSLRDDLDRLYRTDRAQVRLLFNRYLTDYVYQLKIGRDLESEYRPEMSESSEAIDELERRALQRMQPIATSLFNEQFRRNIHATRLTSGDRAQFEITIFQQLRLRLFRSKSAQTIRPRLDAEIVASIHLAYLGTTPLAKTSWELTNDDPDPRLVNRWLEIPWGRFETGAERVLVTFRIDQKFASGILNDASQGYRIRNRRSRSTYQIEIIASSAQGAFYGLNRLEQLGGARQLGRDIDLTEIPRNPQRGVIEVNQGNWSLRERLDLIAFLGRNRMNSYTILLPSGAEMKDPVRARLQSAANASFVNLTIEQRDAILPANRPLTSEETRFCLATYQSASVFHLSGTPYSLWRQIALAAEAAWDPGTFHAGRAIDHFLTTEEPSLLNSAATDQSTDSGSATRQDCIDLPPLNPDGRSLSGRRTVALMRGELKNSIINSKAGRSAR